MITHDNFAEFIKTIDKKKLRRVLNGRKDYILLRHHIFNVGGYATIKELDYCEKTEKKAQEHGDLFTDKDNFMYLLEQNGFRI